MKKIAKFWDNSQTYHGKLLWEGENPKEWKHWNEWINEYPKKKGKAPFADVSLEYTKIK